MAAVDWMLGVRRFHTVRLRLRLRLSQSIPAGGQLVDAEHSPQMSTVEAVRKCNNCLHAEPQPDTERLQLHLHDGDQPLAPHVETTSTAPSDACFTHTASLGQLPLCYQSRSTAHHIIHAAYAESACNKRTPLYTHRIVSPQDATQACPSPLLAPAPVS
jgi:hypothetical protein